MSPRKLSDGDRQEILELYRNTEETTSTLAVRFGVSSSTVSRFLKISLSDLEYEDLIQEKRLARTTRGSSETENQAQLNLTSTTKVETQTLLSEIMPDKQVIINPTSEIPPVEETVIQEEENLILDIPVQETFTPEVSINIDKPIIKNNPKIDIESNNILFEPEEVITPQFKKEEENIIDYTQIEEEGELDEEDNLESVNALAAMFGEDMEDEDDDDDDEDDEDDDEDDEDAIQPISKKNIPPELLKVLPLAKANFPKVCYLVIDRYSELITKPLREFADLGKISGQETQQLTLPVFDNHRVAKRFCDAKGTHSARKGKVIKVPDGRILQKTSSFLQAKGISCILIDGKIYSLI